MIDLLQESDVDIVRSQIAQSVVGSSKRAMDSRLQAELVILRGSLSRGQLPTSAKTGVTGCFFKGFNLSPPPPHLSAHWSGDFRDGDPERSRRPLPRYGVRYYQDGDGYEAPCSEAASKRGTICTVYKQDARRKTLVAHCPSTVRQTVGWLAWLGGQDWSHEHLVRPYRRVMSSRG